MADVDGGETSGVGTGPVDSAFEAFVGECVAVDLEMEDDRIRDVGAIRSGREFRLRDPESSGDALDRLGEFGRDARFVVGHNVVAHDRRFIKVCRPDAELLRLPLVDTPYLALAFPQRPYHALIKDYKLAGERSDPVEDDRCAPSAADRLATSLPRTPTNTPRTPPIPPPRSAAGRRREEGP